MNFIIKFAFNVLVIFATGYLLSGVTVESFIVALVVALVLALLNTILKPILVMLTIPVTLLTFGLFLLVINAGIIMLAGYFVDGFEVDGFLWALLFSIVVSLAMSLFDSATNKK